MAKIVKPRPKNLREIYYDQLPEPYDTTSTKPGLNQGNRGEDFSTKGDRTKDVSISLMDIDNAIIKYIENSIRPFVIQDGERIKVPVEYGFPELWKTMQENGYLREQSGKMISPIIVFKRDRMEANRTLGTKIDANNPKNFHVFEQTYTKVNQYDNFSALTNRQPVKEFRLVVVPEYITLTYSVVIFTNFLEQNNKIIEAFQYAANTYWGEKNRFLFRANISNYTTTTEYSLGEDRTTRTSFEITLNGYIIPDTINRDVSYPKKFYSKSQIVFNLETDTPEIFTAARTAPATVKPGAVTFPTAQQNISIIDSTAIATYLNSNSTKNTSNVTGTDTATILNTSILVPPAGSGLTTSGKDDFLYFINTANIPTTYVTSFTQTGPDIVIVFDTASIGYSIVSTDVISVVGKFA